MVQLNTIDVVILCGGLGTRLRSEIGESQKVLAPVDDQPFLDTIISYLKEQGFKKIILAAGYKAESIRIHYEKENRWRDLEILTEDKPLGTGGAVHHAKVLIKSDPFVVLNGDSFCRVDYQEFIHFHLNRKVSFNSSLVVTEMKDKKDYGSVFCDMSMKVTGFQEKREENDAAFVNAGIYCFAGDVLKKMIYPKSSLEKNILPMLVDVESLYAFRTDAEFLDIGTPERYRKAQKLLKEN